MNGQWLGNYTGDNTGFALVELDDLRDHYEGRAFAIDDRPSFPQTFIRINTPDKANSTTIKTIPQVLNPETGEPTSWNNVKHMFKDIIFPEEIILRLNATHNKLDINWDTNFGTKGFASLSKSEAKKRSDYNAECVLKWNEFKEYVGKFEYSRYIYRGQGHPWTLRTAYHRTGRSDLSRYIEQDIQILHRHLSATTKHLFDLSNPQQTAAFYALAQHHGYPTPLLDWTYSPYIAAFFAFRLPRENYDDKNNIRVFIFDKREWCKLIQVYRISNARPHFSLIEPLAINNQRMIPQQALSSVTNVDDVESYIRSKETEYGKQYLKVVEIPYVERDRVVSELRLMGITAGALFPGLDGACEELRERFFSKGGQV